MQTAQWGFSQLGGCAMSDIAKEYLRELQDNLGWDSFFQDISKNHHFQELSNYHYLQPLTQEEVRDGLNKTSVPSVLNGIRILGKSLQQTPLVTSLPTNNFNACATHAPDQYPIVFLEARLQRLLIYLSSGIGKLILVERDPQVACFIILLTSLDAAYPNISPDIPKLLNPDQLPRDFPSFDYVFRVANAFEQFVVAHEFAHHILGHLDEMTSISLNGDKDAIPLNIFSRAQQEELDADSLAYDIYIANLHSQPYDETGRYDIFDTLPLVFFKFLQMVYTIRDWESDSHPPPEERMEQLFPKFQAVARGKAVSWLTSITSTFENIWPQFLEYMDNMELQGNTGEEVNDDGI